MNDNNTNKLVDEVFEDWINNLDNKNIYVQIASYRDPELLPTIKDCLQKAKHPERLRFGICWQHSDDDEWDDLSEYMDDYRFRIIDVPWNKSKGLCWARSEIQKRWENEAYTLQLDSHHRFAENWDIELIEMLHSIDAYKPIITGYCGRYDPSTNEKIDGTYNPLKIVPKEFRPVGTIIFSSQFIENPEQLKGPVRARFMSGHFFFTYGIHAKQYKYDPNMYFLGDEITLSVKSYTLGYDLFHPHKTLVWHEYIRENKQKHWTDFNTENKKAGKTEVEWGSLANESFRRIRHLLQEEYHEDIDLGEYGLGGIRSIQDYELYAGINFAHKAIHEKSKKGIYPPINDCTEWYKKEPKRYQLDLPIPKTESFSFIYVGIEAENGEVIFRNDLTEYIPVVHADFTSTLEPFKWVYWPVSKNGEWGIPQTTRISGIDQTALTEETHADKPNSILEKRDNYKIFVQIASYRDPHLLNTIRNAMNNADNPELLNFGICWQKDETESLRELECHPQVRYLSYHYSQSQGLGWARNKLNTLYDGEDFILQLDSHHAFAKGWDTMLLEDYVSVSKRSEKPIITTYAPPFSAKRFYANEQELNPTPTIMTPHKFVNRGLLTSRVSYIKNHTQKTEPLWHSAISAHFFFTSANFLQEVPYDPEIYFGGECEETTLSLRAWTRGYDFFAPHRAYIWHDYSREGRNALIWDDDKTRPTSSGYSIKNELSHKKTRQLFGQENNDILITAEYGAGNLRTLEQYEKYTGVDFRNQTISDYRLNGQELPHPDYDSITKRS